MCFERLHICTFQNKILDLKLASQHACIPGTTRCTSNSTSSYKQKKHVLQEKILSTAKDCKKHFKCASCLIGTVTDPNSSSKIQHTMKTKRSNQKNTQKKKNFGHQRKQTLEAIALDTNHNQFSKSQVSAKSSP
jgi:hypothetical protein